jgi:hypothetical protein
VLLGGVLPDAQLLREISDTPTETKLLNGLSPLYTMKARGADIAPLREAVTLEADRQRLGIKSVNEHQAQGNLAGIGQEASTEGKTLQSFLAGIKGNEARRAFTQLQNLVSPLEPGQAGLFGEKNRSSIADVTDAEMNQVLKSSKRITKAADGLKNVIGGSGVGGEDALPEEIEGKIAKRLEQERKDRQTQADAAAQTIVPGAHSAGDQVVGRDRQSYDLLTKNGVVSPEQFRREYARSPAGSSPNERLFDHSIGNKRLIPARDFATLAPFEGEGGAEHRVYLLPGVDKIIKATRPPSEKDSGRVGISPTLDDYLDRAKKMDDLSEGALGTGVLGVTMDRHEGTPSLVTEMKNIIGHHIPDPEIHNALVNRYGFELVNPGTLLYRHVATGVEIYDAHGQNFLKTPVGDYTPEQKRDLVENHRDDPSIPWRYIPIDIGVRGDVTKPIFGAAVRDERTPGLFDEPARAREEVQPLRHCITILKLRGFDHRKVFSQILVT